MMLKVRKSHLGAMNNNKEEHEQSFWDPGKVLYFLIWAVITPVCSVCENSSNYIICLLCCIYTKWLNKTLIRTNKSLRFLLTNRISSSFISLVISAFAFCTASSLAPGEWVENTSYYWNYTGCLSTSLRSSRNTVGDFQEHCTTCQEKSFNTW